MHFVDPVVVRPFTARYLKFSLENITSAVGISKCSSWMFMLKNPEIMHLPPPKKPQNKHQIQQSFLHQHSLALYQPITKDSVTAKFYSNHYKIKPTSHKTATIISNMCIYHKKFSSTSYFDIFWS